MKLEQELIIRKLMGEIEYNERLSASEVTSLFGSNLEALALETEQIKRSLRDFPVGSIYDLLVNPSVFCHPFVLSRSFGKESLMVIAYGELIAQVYRARPDYDYGLPGFFVPECFAKMPVTRTNNSLFYVIMLEKPEKDYSKRITDNMALFRVEK